MHQTITLEKVEHYFSITEKALEQAQGAFDHSRKKEAAIVYDMASGYVQDAHYFFDEKKDLVLAFAALNYAHGWLDAGARLGLFTVNDHTLFVLDS